MTCSHPIHFTHTEEKMLAVLFTAAVLLLGGCALHVAYKRRAAAEREAIFWDLRMLRGQG